MGTMPLIPLPTMLLFIILLPITLPFTILLPTTLLFTILLPTTLPYMQPLTTLPHIMVQYLVVLPPYMQPLTTLPPILPPYMQPLTSLPPILSPLPYLVHMLQKKHKSLVKTLLHLCQGCFNPYLLLLLYFKC